MIHYEEFTLDNGLEVIVHEDQNTELAIVNLLYKVGSRDENPDKTGFAHLFEHLMFGGSKNVPSYDEPLQMVGADNNAFTSPDITNYYVTLPAANLETAFWLESDRMLSLSFDPKVLEVQRKVVIEEFKQRYLNQPYGDIWMKLRSLAYDEYPYNWAPIGKEISHIEDATMEDVRAFFKKFYVPNNAILVVAGKVTTEKVKALCDKWFAPIPKGEAIERNYPTEPYGKGKRTDTVTAPVPASAIYKAYQVPERDHAEYYHLDMLSDILGRGKSSRLYEQLVKKDKVFNSVGCYLTGSAGPGLFVISGKVTAQFSLEEAEAKIDELVHNFLQEEISERELTKVKNKAEASLVFAETELMNRATNLAYYKFLGDTALINREVEEIHAVQADRLSEIARKYLVEENATVLYYNAEK
ncbi:MAG: pitrilysin family protein [Cyclobacteriaceae bacterium]